MITKKRMIYLAPVLAVVVSTLMISACSEDDNKAASQQVEEQAGSMLAEVKEVVAESGGEMSQSVTNTIDEVKEKVEMKSEKVTENVKTAVAEMSDQIAEKTVQTAAVISDKVAAVDGAALFKSKGCAGCHATSAMGAIGPRLAGQLEEYIVDQFKLIRDGKRTSGQSAMMSGAVKSVTDAEIVAIAGYLTAL